jgi:hypothetical protein
MAGRLRATAPATALGRDATGGADSNMTVITRHAARRDSRRT